MPRLKCPLSRPWAFLLVVSGALVWATGAEAQNPDCHLLDPDLTDPALRDVVFEGHLIGYRQAEGSIWSVFLVQRSWKGLGADTISVDTQADGVMPARRGLQVGGRYLVFGDRVGSRVLMRPCDHLYWIGSERGRIQALGSPERTLTPEALSALGLQIGSPAEAGRGDPEIRVPVEVTISGEHGVLWDVLVELGGETRRTDVFGRVLFETLPEGLYQGRVVTDTLTVAFPLTVNCVEISSQCTRLRPRVRMDPIQPGDRRSALAREVGFTAFTTPPELQNRARVERRLNEDVRVVPLYLEMGRQVRRDPSVWFHLLVNEQGEVENLKLGRSFGQQRVDLAVIKALQKARFSPGRNRDMPVPVWITGSVLPSRN